MDKENKTEESSLMDQSENPLDQSESVLDKSEITKCLSTSSGKKRKLTQEERDQMNQEREVKRMAMQKEKEEKAERRRLEKERLQRQREEEKERKRLEDEEAKRKKEEELERKRLEQEEAKKKREEEKERKRREEEEAKRKREEEIERKRLEQEEAKKKKDEEKERKRREEEQRKEQKRRQEEEVEMKKKRMSQSFINFFQKIEKSEPPPTLPMPANSRFKPFEIKEGMSLAPIHRRALLAPDDYESLLQNQISEPTDYLFEISKKNHKLTSEMPDVIPINRLKAKLFQFHDNYRHPYYGTWRRRSKFITGRRPFSTSDKTLDYEYDSDQDWEDDPSDGDECKSDEEDNEKEEIDDEEDEGFFVGHGYLSPGEGSEDEDENLPNRHAKETDEQRRQRLAHTDQEWKEAQKQKKQKTKGPKKLRLNPTIYGPSWTDPDKDEHNSVLRHLMAGVTFDYASLNIQKAA